MTTRPSRGPEVRTSNLSLRQDVFAFHGDVVHTRGRHLPKGGVLAERYKQDMLNPTFSLGIYTFPSAKDGYVIVPTAFGVVSCLDAKTGKLHWEKEFDRGFWSSPIVVGERVYLIDLSGVMQVFKLGGEFELLAASEIGEEAYATPAVVGDRIHIRGLGRLFCVGARPK